MEDLKHADSSVDGCIKRAVQLHGERVRALVSVATDTLDHSSQLLHVVHHHLDSILHRVQCGLEPGQKRWGVRVI